MLIRSVRDDGRTACDLWRLENFMYTIGDFSKITGLTVKTLRFYHEQGLLIPRRSTTRPAIATTTARRSRPPG